MLVVLRIGHRPFRDKRVTTHAALVARALGADGMIISAGDEEIEQNIDSVVSRFGGRFEIRSGVPWKMALNSWKGLKIHLTMYGLPLDDVIEEIRGKDAMIIIGAEKVPADIYKQADFNIAVGNQPHSEIAALALFLDRYFEGAELKRAFENAEMTIIPNPRGKTVAEAGKEEKQSEEAADQARVN